MVIKRIFCMYACIKHCNSNKLVMLSMSMPPSTLGVRMVSVV